MDYNVIESRGCTTYLPSDHLGNIYTFLFPYSRQNLCNFTFTRFPSIILFRHREKRHGWSSYFGQEPSNGYKVLYISESSNMSLTLPDVFPRRLPGVDVVTSRVGGILLFILREPTIYYLFIFPRPMVNVIDISTYLALFPTMWPENNFLLQTHTSEGVVPTISPFTRELL